MTANRTQNAALDQRLILELRIDASGEVTRKPTKLGRKDTLEGKLLGQLYPGIRVARVSVPYELTPYEQSVVENRMASLIMAGSNTNWSARAVQRRMESFTSSIMRTPARLLSAFSIGPRRRSCTLRSSSPTAS